MATTTTMQTNTWTLRLLPSGSYAVTRGGVTYGECDITSARADWHFAAGSPRPSATTQRRLLAALRAEVSRG